MKDIFFIELININKQKMNLTPLILQFLLILFSLNNWMLQIIIQNKQISFFKHTFYKNLKSFFFILIKILL